MKTEDWEAIAKDIYHDERTKLLAEESSLSVLQLLRTYLEVDPLGSDPEHDNEWIKRFFAWVDFNLSGENKLNDFHELDQSFDEAYFDESANNVDE